MSSGEAMVDRWIASLRALPRELRGEALASVMEAEVKRTAAAGTTPDGSPWPARKDGGRALANASSQITTVVGERRVSLILSGPAAIHNYGTTKDPKRQVLPTVLGAGLAERMKAEVYRRIRSVLGVR